MFWEQVFLPVPSFLCVLSLSALGFLDSRCVAVLTPLLRYFHECSVKPSSITSATRATPDHRHCLRVIPHGADLRAYHRRSQQPDTGISLEISWWFATGYISRRAACHRRIESPDRKITLGIFSRQSRLFKRHPSLCASFPDRSGSTRSLLHSCAPHRSPPCAPIRRRAHPSREGREAVRRIKLRKK